MSRIPQTTTSTRLSVPRGELRVPSPPQGEGLAQGLQAVSQATQKIAESERQNDLVAFETRLMQAEAQAKEQMRRAEPGQQEEVLEEAFSPFRDEVDQVTNGKLRQEMNLRLRRRRAMMEGDMIRARTRASLDQMENNLLQQRDTLKEQLVQGDIDLATAREQYEQSISGFADSDAISEANKTEIVQDAHQDFAETTLSNLIDTRGKTARQLESDLREAGELLDDSDVRSTLTDSAQRVFSYQIRRGREGLSESIQAQGLSEVRQSWNQGLLGDTVNRTAVTQGVEQLNQLASEGLVDSEVVSDLATEYADAIAQGEPSNGLQKLAVIESVLSDQEGIAISPEVREHIDRARNRLVDRDNSADVIDRAASQLVSDFASGKEASGDISPDVWDGFEERAIDELGHDPADVVSYMASHDAPLEGVRSRLEDAFSGELRASEGVRMQRALKPGQRLNLMSDDGMDENARVLGNVAFEMMRDIPTNSPQGEQIIRTIEQNRSAIVDAGVFSPGAASEDEKDDFDQYDPSEALLNQENVGELVPVQMQRRLEARFRFLASQEVALDRDLRQANIQKLANRAGSQVWKHYKPTRLRNAPPLPNDIKVTGQTQQLIDGLRQRGATGETGVFSSNDMPLMHLTWETEEGKQVVPITSADGGPVTEFAVSDRQGNVNFVMPDGEVENAQGRRGARQPELFGDLRQQMIERGVNRQSDIDPLSHDPTTHGRAPLASYSPDLFRKMRDAALRAWTRQGHDPPDSNDEESKAAFRSFFIQYARDVKGWPRVMPDENQQ